MVFPASTSPRSEPARRLTASIVPHTAVTLEERRQMFALLRKHFAGTARERFEADLREKETVILLRDAGSGRIQGFSTLMRMTAQLDRKDIVAFFSGDTIIDREYWGESTLSRAWGQVVFGEADRIAAERPDTSVYWFLICSGYKTWRFLPVFFREFYPNAARPTPPDVRRLIDTLAARKFGDEYLPAEGVVRFREATPLRSGIADVTDERLRDPQVAFFARVNPGHAAGDELVCLTEIARSNLTRAGLRMIATP
jgi:hypothetical protein